MFLIKIKLSLNDACVYRAGCNVPLLLRQRSSCSLQCREDYSHHHKCVWLCMHVGITMLWHLVADLRRLHHYVILSHNSTNMASTSYSKLAIVSYIGLRNTNSA